MASCRDAGTIEPRVQPLRLCNPVTTCHPFTRRLLAMSLVRVGADHQAVQISSRALKRSHCVCNGRRRLPTSARPDSNYSSIRRPHTRHLPRLGLSHSRYYSSTPGQCNFYNHIDFVNSTCSNTSGSKASNLPDAPKIAVVGGGLTGLTAAYFLAKRLDKSAQITVYEASSRWGGWLRSERTPVDVGGVKTEVLFERGARSMSTAQTGGRMDRLILYQLVSGPHTHYLAEAWEL